MRISQRRMPVWSLVIGYWSLVLVLGWPLQGEEAASRSAESEQRLRHDITYLASPECEGRGPTTKGLDRAADFIANEFKKAGLAPGNPDGSYYQPFTTPSAVLQGEPTLVLTGPQGQVVQLKRGVHFDVMGLGGSGALANVPVVFAGYGVASEMVGYDDYSDLDVAGKVVVLLRDVPRAANPELSGKLKAQAPFVTKLTRAERQGARGVLFVNDAESAREGDDLLDFNYTALGGQAANPPKVPAIFLRRSVLETMLRHSTSQEVNDLEKSIDRDFKPQSLELTGWTLSLNVEVQRGKVGLKNVVGVLEGKGPLARQTVVVGAHYDHLGYGGNGSLAQSKKMTIHHGADDNGSGTTTVLELARRFAAQPNRQGRRLVFILFSGEELGLLGSKHYCKEPLFPLEDTASMFNLDMVGRLRSDAKNPKDRLLVEGSNTAKVFDEILDTLNQKHEFDLKKSETMPPNSDHFSFYQKKIPVLFFWTGIHPDYHKPSDTADKINVVGMRRIADLSEEVITRLATMEKRPDYIQVKVGSSGGGPRGDTPRLGVIPAYDDDGKDGLRIEGANAGTPGAKAGLKAGDRIVSLAGKPVKNIQSYMQIMATQKKGETLEIGIVRDGKTMTVKALLE